MEDIIVFLSRKVFISVFISVTEYIPFLLRRKEVAFSEKPQINFKETKTWNCILDQTKLLKAPL